MKRACIYFLVAVLTASFAGCGGGGRSAQNVSEASNNGDDSDDNDIDEDGLEEFGEVVQTWEISSGVAATLFDDGTLIVSGDGEMWKDWGEKKGEAPWSDHKDQFITVIIKDGVTTIGREAFSGCASLTSVTIPESVAKIEEFAFMDCTGLTAIDVEDNNAGYSSIDGVLFNKNKTILIHYPGGKQGAYTISGSITEIEEFAFSGSAGLTSITIPRNVKVIGDNAFEHCTAITSVTVPGNATVGWGTFTGCTGLTSVVIQNGILETGAYMFADCTGITSVTIPGSMKKIEEGTFYGCTGLTSISIPRSVTTIEERAFEGCVSLTSITVLASAPFAIANNVFNGTPASACLSVPAGSIDRYKNTEGWKRFTCVGGLK